MSRSKRWPRDLAIVAVSAFFGRHAGLGRRESVEAVHSADAEVGGEAGLRGGELVSAATDWDVDPERAYTYDIQETVHWAAKSTCGFDSLTYDAYEVDAEDFSDPAWTDTVSDYDGSFGGGSSGGGSSVVEEWSIVARDGCGNATGRTAGIGALVAQEDGFTPSNNGGPRVSIAYSGSWGVSNCDCLSGGDTARTSSSGASASITAAYKTGDHIALVMAEGPGRGRADILIDGVRTSTINTYAPTNTNRRSSCSKRRWMPARTRLRCRISRRRATHASTSTQ